MPKSRHSNLSMSFLFVRALVGVGLWVCWLCFQVMLEGRSTGSSRRTRVEPCECSMGHGVRIPFAQFTQHENQTNNEKMQRCYREADARGLDATTCLKPGAIGRRGTQHCGMSSQKSVLLQESKCPKNKAHQDTQNVALQIYWRTTGHRTMTLPWMFSWCRPLSESHRSCVPAGSSRLYQRTEVLPNLR
jgi:hypothetical protein